MICFFGVFGSALGGILRLFWGMLVGVLLGILGRFGVCVGGMFAAFCKDLRGNTWAGLFIEYTLVAE